MSLRLTREERELLDGAQGIPSRAELQAEITSLKSQLEEAICSKWRDIETAPKDGTCFLAYIKTSPTPGNGRRQIIYWNGQWVDTGGPIWAGAPTHWMPLPSPPGAELNFSNESERDAVSLKQISSLKSTVDRLREALKRCIDDILAKATFDATPKFIAERSPVVVQARAALADVPAPVTPSADVERLRGALEKTVDCLKFYVKREGESPYRDACSDVRGIDELIEARAALTASAAPSTEV